MDVDHGPLRTPRARTDPCAELRFVQHQVCGIRSIGHATAAHQHCGMARYRESAAPTRISERPELRRSRSNWTRHIRIAPHCASSAIVLAGGSTAAGSVRSPIVSSTAAVNTSSPVRVDANVLADLKGYIPLAPLHQPFALEAVESCCGSSRDLCHRWPASTRPSTPTSPGREGPAVALCRMGARSASVRVSRPVV